MESKKESCNRRCEANLPPHADLKTLQQFIDRGSADADLRGLHAEDKNFLRRVEGEISQSRDLG